MRPKLERERSSRDPSAPAPSILYHDPEGWYGEGGGRGVQDEEHVYTRGRFMLMYVWQNQYNIVK